MDELPVILVIEDEYPVQGMVEEWLTEGGFGADILSSGEEALTLFKSGLKNYKALVTDVSLKGRLSGWDIARRIREIDPAFPTVYMTGALRDPNGHRRAFPTAFFSPSRSPRRSSSPPCPSFSMQRRRLPRHEALLCRGKIKGR